MKTKKCKTCKGTGFTFKTVCSIRGFKTYEFLEKSICTKCFGKGMK